MISANSGAALDQVRAGLLPSQTAADIAEAKARTNATNVTADLAPGLAKASEAQSYGNAYANRQQGGLYGAQTSGELQDQQISPSLGMVGNSIIQRLRQQLGLPVVQ
jgi:hypothetical protein